MKNPKNSRDTKPATITIANGFCVSDPIPVDSAAGNKPTQATSAVMMMGRTRSKAASRVALVMSIPSRRSLFMYEIRITPVYTDPPLNASSPSADDTLNGVCVNLRAMSAPTGSVMITSSAMAMGNLKFP
jgi:hypothetical protein